MNKAVRNLSFMMAILSLTFAMLNIPIYVTEHDLFRIIKSLCYFVIALSLSMYGANISKRSTLPILLFICVVNILIFINNSETGSISLIVNCFFLMFFVVAMNKLFNSNN